MYRLAMFILTGWQDDDLPQFSEIKDILITNSTYYLSVRIYTTIGIARHFHSYMIKRTNEEDILSLNKLQGYPPMVGHSMNRQLYITLRSHIIKS
jgi:hypothetical protein